MLVVGLVLLTALAAAGIAARLLSNWAKLSGGWSVGASAGAVVLTAVGFPIWFGFALYLGAYFAAFWRRPWARRSLSKMANRIGVRAGTVVTEQWGGDGVIAGWFHLSILAMFPGSPDQVIGELARRAADAGYGGPEQPRVRSARTRPPRAPSWRVRFVIPEEAARYGGTVGPGSTAAWVTLTEGR